MKKVKTTSADFRPEIKVKCINDKGIPDYVKEMGVQEGKTFTIREIGERDFLGKGGGLRLNGIILYSDLTGYEKCFGRERFEVVKTKNKK